MFGPTPTNGRHPKCRGYMIDTPNGRDYDCEYGSELTCDECKYGLGRKDPEAKCNQPKDA
ncbi:hypothetical protein [Azospirillum sp. TSO5]|uniref:hypothetical protein n=1 Tax=Azospirillum sp. TSO5 TaxID=716760 RepID=UPI000D6486FF|nr:hypothetical protein [Azospirillum sp. TSO5]